MNSDERDELLIRLDTKMDTVGERLNDHGARLRLLEGLAKTAIGALSILGILGGWFKVSASIK